MTKKKVVSTSSHVDPSKAGDRKSAGTGKVYRGTVEAQWTCNSCGREGIPGRQKRCPSCGNPKDASETYEAPSTSGNYLSKQDLAALGVDPNLHLSDEECEFCGAKLKPGTPKCPNCGASLGDVGYTTRHCPACGMDSNEDKCPNCGSPTEEKLTAYREAEPPPAAPPSKPAAPKPKSKFLSPQYLIPAIIIILLMCIGGCLAIFASIPRSDTATVTALAWERSIGIQEHQYNRHEDWDLPSGADLDSREERIHHYDKVQIGTDEECGYEEKCETQSVYDHTETTCYDDGTCDEHDVYRDERECTDEYVCRDVAVYEDVPVYQTWYTYHIWEWVDIKPAVASGNDNEPEWPKVNLGENQREGEREEECIVTFTTPKDKSYPYNTPCAEMGKYELDAKWEIKRNASRVTEVLSQE